MSHKISGFCWSERKFARLALLDFRVQIQFFELETVGDVLGCYFENHRLTLFNSDFSRFVGESLY